MRWRELSEHNETKIYLKYFGLTRRGLKRREFRSTIDRDASLKFWHNEVRLEILGEQASSVPKQKTIRTSSLERAIFRFTIFLEMHSNTRKKN